MPTKPGRPESRITRRQFLSGTAAAAGCLAVPAVRRLLGHPAAGGDVVVDSGDQFGAVAKGIVTHVVQQGGRPQRQVVGPKVSHQGQNAQSVLQAAGAQGISQGAGPVVTYKVEPPQGPGAQQSALAGGQLD